MRVTARRTVRRRLMGSRTISIEPPSRSRPFGSGGIRILIGFGLILAIATPLLHLPAAYSGEQPTLLESLFTAISAICVTGLVVVDTQTHWSHFGEAVILGLIQVGGLGYMAGMGIVLWALGRNLGLRDRNLMRLYYGAPTMRESVSFVRVIVIYTLTFEVLGALALFGGFVSAGVAGGEERVVGRVPRDLGVQRGRLQRDRRGHAAIRRRPGRAHPDGSALPRRFARGRAGHPRGAEARPSAHVAGREDGALGGGGRGGGERALYRHRGVGEYGHAGDRGRERPARAGLLPGINVGLGLQRRRFGVAARAHEAVRVGTDAGGRGGGGRPRAG